MKLVGFCIIVEDVVSIIVEGGAVPILVKHLQAPPSPVEDDGVKPYEHEVEKASAFALGLLAVKVSELLYCLFFLLNAKLEQYGFIIYLIRY